MGKRASKTVGEVGERTRDGSSEFKLVTLEDEDEKRAKRPLALPRCGPSTPTSSRPPVGTSTETCYARPETPPPLPLFETALARLRFCFNINGKADGKAERKEIEGK